MPPWRRRRVQPGAGPRQMQINACRQTGFARASRTAGSGRRSRSSSRAAHTRVRGEAAYLGSFFSCCKHVDAAESVKDLHSHIGAPHPPTNHWWAGGPTPKRAAQKAKGPSDWAATRHTMHSRSPFYPTASIIHLAGPLSCRPFPRAVRPSRRARRSSTSSSPRRPTALWYASPAEPRPAPSPFCSRARAARPSRFHCKHGNVWRCFDVARTAPPYRAPSASRSPTYRLAPRSSRLAPRSSRR